MSQVFKAKIRKIGNSLGVLIPADVIEELHVDPGDEVSISLYSEDLDLRNERMMKMIGKYKGKGPFVREKEDRY